MLDSVPDLSQFNPQYTSTQPNNPVTSPEPHSTKPSKPHGLLTKSSSLPAQNSASYGTESGPFSTENEDPRLVTLPSSKTPSPLKLPTVQRSHSSPMISGDPARVLKNITTLLGKRSEYSDLEPPPVQKINKRVRPTRTRVCFATRLIRNHYLPYILVSTRYPVFRIGGSYTFSTPFFSEHKLFRKR